MTAPPPESGQIVITMREVYDQLVQLTAEVRELRGSHTRAAEDQQDHETRIRDLEKWRYATTAAFLTALTALVAQIIQILAK
ncbi:hypothetical protein ACFVH6_25675 [Spirillospora sp. NPDC127200]